MKNMPSVTQSCTRSSNLGNMSKKKGINARKMSSAQAWDTNGELPPRNMAWLPGLRSRLRVAFGEGSKKGRKPSRRISEEECWENKEGRTRKVREGKQRDRRMKASIWWFLLRLQDQREAEKKQRDQELRSPRRTGERYIGLAQRRGRGRAAQVWVDFENTVGIAH